MNVHSHTRDAILEAALALFCERGFHGTAVPALAREAGIAAGTIYRHFASKDEIVNALYRAHKQALMAALMEGFPADAPPRAQFAALWQRLAGFARAHPRAFAFLELHHHAPYLDDDSLRLERDSLAPVAALVQGAMDAGWIRAMDPRAAIALVWGAFVGLIKADRQGYLALTDDILAQAETACWNAIANGDNP